MATTTTNFSFPIPQSTDLVKDGATAIAALGTSVDTQFVDLKGGTTGQVLSKASNTDLDYSWVTTDDANAIQNAIVDAKGDLIAASAADTPARLAVGANGTVVQADSTAATGLKYSSNAPLGGMTLLNSGGTALTGAATITISGISNKSRFLVILENASTTAGGSYIGLRLNGAASGYGFTGITITNGNTVSNGSNFVTDRMYTARQGASAADTFGFIANIDGGFDAGVLSWSSNGIASGTNGEAYNSKGFVTTSAQVTSISIVGNDNFDAGTIYMYGA
jgi:hypothetical protein